MFVRCTTWPPERTRALTLLGVGPLTLSPSRPRAFLPCASFPVGSEFRVRRPQTIHQSSVRPIINHQHCVNAIQRSGVVTSTTVHLLTTTVHLLTDLLTTAPFHSTALTTLTPTTLSSGHSRHLLYSLLRCAALPPAARCVALRCVVLRFVSLRCVALRCVALRCVALRCVALRCVEWQQQRYHNTAPLSTVFGLVQ